MPATKTVKVPTYDINDNLEFTVQEIVSMKISGASFEVSMNQSQDGLVFTWTNTLNQPSGSIETAKLNIVNQFNSNGTTMTSSFSGTNTVNRVELGTSIKDALKNNFASISTDNADSQTVLTDANILDVGPINLHKVSSTGKYTDLVDFKEIEINIAGVESEYIPLNNFGWGTYQIFLMLSGKIIDCGICNLDDSKLPSVDSSLEAQAQLVSIPNKIPFKFYIAFDSDAGFIFGITKVKTTAVTQWAINHLVEITTSEEDAKFSDIFSSATDASVIIRRVVAL